MINNILSTEKTFKILPEWHPQLCILLTWPHSYSDWSNTIKNIEQTYLELLIAIAKTEKVVIICFDLDHQKHILEQVKLASIDLHNIKFIIIKTNDTWVRDYGPISVSDNNKGIMLNFHFDGWNKKFYYDLDNQVNQQLFNSTVLLNSEHIDINLILEGGSIDSNGLDTILTSKKCLLSRNNLDQKTYAKLFSQLFGIKHVFWLEHSYLEGDDTDGHIDNLVRFINTDTILYLNCNDPNDQHYKSLKGLERELFSFNHAVNNKFKLIPIPLPHPIVENGKRLPASYLNFLITNKTIIVPVFNQEIDQLVLNTIKNHSDRKNIIGIKSTELITQGGSIHCASMQIAKI